jgi:glycosyltransferase involved in cell wall biosynthesis
MVVVLDEEIAAEQMPSLYKGADAFVLPSRGEGWGIPYMEAMAMALPTIGTKWVCWRAEEKQDGYHQPTMLISIGST